MHRMQLNLAIHNNQLGLLLLHLDFEVPAITHILLCVVSLLPAVTL